MAQFISWSRALAPVFSASVLGLRMALCTPAPGEVSARGAVGGVLLTNLPLRALSVGRHTRPRVPEPGEVVMPNDEELPW